MGTRSHDEHPYFEWRRKLSEMLERCARAVCASRGLDWDAQASWLTSGSGTDEEQQGFFDDARAVLAELAKPTPGMIEAGSDAAGDICGHWPEAAADAFTAMITAAQGAGG